MDLKRYIRTVPDFPEPGVQFRDITTLLADAGAFGYTVDALVERCRPLALDAIAGVESRGFIFAAAVAHHLGLPFVPVRKEGKLPHATMRQEYALEYGEEVVEIHRDALAEGRTVAVVDDLLATGGTLLASAKLVEMLGAKVAACFVVIELTGLGGRRRLADYAVDALVAYQVE